MKLTIVVPYTIEKSGIVIFALRLAEAFLSIGLDPQLLVVGDHKRDSVIPVLPYASFGSLVEWLMVHSADGEVTLFLGFPEYDEDIEKLINLSRVLQEELCQKVFVMWERAGETNALLGLSKGRLESLRVSGVLALNLEHLVVLQKLSLFQVFLISPGVDTHHQFYPLLDQGAKLSLRMRLEWPIEKIIVLSVGRFTLRKRTDFLVKCWLNSRFSDKAFLVLCGSGFGQPDSVETEVRRLAEDRQNIRIVLHRDDENRAPYYQAADVFVATGVSEGEPTVLSEAMACGLPVVASNIPGHTRLVIPDQTGVLYEADNCELLLHGLGILIENRGLRGLMGKHARANAVSERDIKAVAGKIADIIKMNFPTNLQEE